MKHPILLILLIMSTPLIAQSQQPVNYKKSAWHLHAPAINPTDYFGVTLANGIIGLVTSPEPTRIKTIVLNGAFDTYGRGRVSNILQGFNFADVDLRVGGTQVNSSNVSDYSQTLDMQQAVFTSSFTYNNQVKATYTLRALRHLPYTALIDVEVTATDTASIYLAHQMQAPDILRAR